MSENRFDLSAALGETLDVTVTLTDETEENVLDLTGSTLEAVLEPYDLGEDPPVRLTSGHGLICNEPKTGRVRLVVVIDPTLFDIGLGRWRLRRVNPEGGVTYPMGGKLTIGRA